MGACILRKSLVRIDVHVRVPQFILIFSSFKYAHSVPAHRARRKPCNVLVNIDRVHCELYVTVRLDTVSLVSHLWLVLCRNVSVGLTGGA